jgi:secondary thiamine-phosphate synthase enzyme
MIATLDVETKSKTVLIDITSQVDRIVKESGVKSGICYLFVPHTTAGITINENADLNVIRDILMEINKIVPEENNYIHLEGNSPAHIKASVVGASEIIPIEDSKLLLGTWQGIYFCEFDGPRRRKVFVGIICEK